MKHLWLSYTFSMLFLSLLTCLALWYFNPLGFGIPDKILSPLPDFLTIVTNNQVSTIHLFQPVIGGASANEGSITDLTARSVLLFDLSTNKTIFAKNPSQRMPMASLTKIMTAIVGIEHKKDDDLYTVPRSALLGEDSMGVDEGEKLSLEELLYGLVLHSGNDAAEVIAWNFPGGRDEFVKAMNQKAQALGLTDTNFTNPSGLQGDGDQFTTAHDLLVMTTYALTNLPLFKQVVATTKYDIAANANHKHFYLENETNLLTTYPGVKGVKTGYTPEAGYCLVTYLDYEGHQIVGILLGSENRREEMKNLLDFSLKSFGVAPPEHE